MTTLPERPPVASWNQMIDMTGGSETRGLGVVLCAISDQLDHLITVGEKQVEILDAIERGQ